MYGLMFNDSDDDNGDFNVNCRKLYVNFKQKHWKQLSFMLALQSSVFVYAVPLWASSHVTPYPSTALRLN